MTQYSHSTSSTRPFSLSLYLLIVFGLSWPFQIASAIWATDLLPRYALNSSSMIMVTVGTWIAGRYVFRDGFAQAGWQWGKLKHYGAVIGLVVLLWILPVLIGLAFGTLKWPNALAPGQVTWIFVLLFGTLIPGFGEEFGWRGYMLPHLLQRMSARRAVGLHAVIWWVWHWPILIGTGVQAGMMATEKTGLPVGIAVITTVGTIILLGAFPAIMHGVVFAYIWSSSYSLAVATVYHALYDGVRDSLTLTVGLGSFTPLWASGVLSLLGVILLWKGHWRNDTAEISNNPSARLTPNDTF